MFGPSPAPTVLQWLPSSGRLTRGSSADVAPLFHFLQRDRHLRVTPQSLPHVAPKDWLHETQQSVALAAWFVGFPTCPVSANWDREVCTRDRHTAGALMPCQSLETSSFRGQAVPCRNRDPSGRWCHPGTPQASCALEPGTVDGSPNHLIGGLGFGWFDI